MSEANRAAALPSSYLLKHYQLSAPRLLAQTPRANLWQVRRANGEDAVLKHLTDEGAASDEARAGEVLAQWAGQNAVQIYASHKTASQNISFLIEWLGGPSLGDLARGGQDSLATAQLAQVATALSRPAVAGFPDLSTNGTELLATPLSALPPTHRGVFALAQTLWPKLLASTTQPHLLHADLHHDNILKGPRGWCAIDPRGLNGDPAYEFANAFRNPTGMGDKTADPARILHMAGSFAAHSGLDQGRILQFAFAHCAMSISWTLKHSPAPKGDLRLLDLFAALIAAP
ncbi:aminoglycoside phosphotransferase family protein [Pacificibacter sp. AS14]|uniref:aminoglycoside phosphotransferase family protein n=1 Tax=Pacificibacter sp. AS14 TaxID=3135785 RepID=UPI00316BDF43